MQEDKNAIFQMRFPQKLWYLLKMRTDAILWGGTGRTILLNYRILHSYLQCDHSIFKTTNISSFVRQLNLYGFRKVTSHLQDPLCNSCNPYMHEYVHDYFQYGRPELLNKITRKALALRKNFKPKSMYSNSDPLLYLSPLQKARRALREALKKAAQDLFVQNSPKQVFNINFECEDPQEDFCENEENMEFDWLIAKNFNRNTEQPATQPANKTESINALIHPKLEADENSNFGKSSQDGNFIPFKEDSNLQNNDFPSQFLSMPDLDAEPHEKTGEELLAEFNIDAHGCMVAEGKGNGHNSLNCVLPSINNDPNDDVSMSEKENENLDQYNGEWDQMFSDIMINKGNNQECGSDLKELYSQISKTIDLLND